MINAALPAAHEEQPRCFPCFPSSSVSVLDPNTSASPKGVATMNMLRGVCFRTFHCAWCWQALGLMRWYPESWSSSICHHHERQMVAQRVARRALRAQKGEQ